MFDTTDFYTFNFWFEEEESQRGEPPEARSTVSDVGDGDLDVHARLNRDGSDAADNVLRRVQVDHALVDAHLKAVPPVQWTVKAK